jgi:PAS domain S-box-containing protein
MKKTIESDNGTYELLFHTISEGFLITRLIRDDHNKITDIQITDANPASEKHSGLSRKELIGKFISEVLPAIHKAWFVRFDKIVKSGKDERFRYYSEPLKKWFEIYGFPLNDGLLGILFTDITVQLTDEKIIRENSLRYSALLNARINGVAHCKVITDEQGIPVDYRIIQVNESYTSITGIKKEDIEGKTAREVFPGIENFSFDFIKEYGKVALEGSEISFETFFEVTKQWLSIYAYSPLPGEFTAIFTDISEKKLNESARNNERELLQIILNSIPVMITIYNPEITSITVNKEFERVSGWTQEMIDQGNVLELLYPDMEYRIKAAEFVQSGSGWRDFTMTKSDGSTVETAWANIKIPDGRQVGIGLDISERKKAEEIIRTNEAMLQAFFDSSPGILNLFDQDLKYLKTDPLTPTYFQHDRWSIIGKSVNDLNPVFAEEVLQKILLNVISSRKPLLDIEVQGPIPSRMNETGNWLMSYFPVPLPDGKDGLGVMGIDVTSQKKAESALRKSEELYKELAKNLEVERNKLEKTHEQIEDRLREKEVLLRELYHRTKNNMQVISSLLGLKSAMHPGSDIQSVFEDMQKRIKSIALVHEKLYQSRNLSRVNLKEYFIDLVSLLRSGHSVGEEKISFGFELEDISVLIDTAVPCGLMVTELIINSLKHAFPADRKGQILLKMKKIKDNSIELTISDNGVGFSKDIMAGENMLGLHLFRSIAEHQLEADVDLDLSNGVTWKILFSDKLYNERI